MEPTAAVLDLGVSHLPSGLFMLVHLTALAVGIVLAKRAFGAGVPVLGWGFVLYAVAEVVYFGYHAGVTTFLLSHTLAEVLDLVAFVLAGAALASGAAKELARTTPA